MDIDTKRWNVGFILAVVIFVALAYLLAKQVNDTRIETALIMEELRALRVDFEEVKLNGSPITDKRLTVLELKIEKIK